MPVAHFEGGRLSFRCPGCQDIHTVNAGADAGPPCWGWNGSLERPTLSPSILAKSGHFASGHRPGEDGCWCDYNREHPEAPVSFACYFCHSFVEGGRIRFLPDCSHSLAGQTVELPPWEEIC